MTRLHRTRATLCLAFALAAAVAAASLPASAAVRSATPPTAGAGTSTAAVAPAQDPVPGQYIVELAPGASSQVATRAEQLAGSVGADVEQVYYQALQGFSIQATPAEAQALAGQPGVASVSEDGFVHATATQSTPPSWGLDRIDQHPLPLDAAYHYATGAPTVHAYVLDTAIRLTHQDFGGRATSGWDFVDDDANAGDDCSGGATGHGTHVAGTTGGSAFGVAKSVQIVAVRVLDCSGNGLFSDVIAGIDWVAANAQRPAVANMSLGGAASSPVDQALANAVASGITFVVAAGNTNTDACGSSPAREPTAITVAATTSADARASFSNFGSCVDIFAPGDSIVSDWRTSDTATSPLSGTSMASPHVTGVAAAYLQRNPLASPSQVASALVAAATPNVVSGVSGSPNRLLYSAVAAAAPDPFPLHATPGVAEVDLSWVAPIDGGTPVTGYEVRRGTSAGDESHLADVGAGVTTYADTTATPGAQYFYVVDATNAVGTTPSNEATATAASPTAPDPASLSASATYNKVQLSWVAPPSGGSPITGYEIHRGTSTGTESFLTSVGPGITTFADSTGTNGTPYFYVVRAVNAIGSTPSNEVVATPVAPTAPGAPALTAVGQATKISLSWTVPPAGGSAITGYEIRRGASTGTESFLTSVGPGLTTFDDSSAAPGTTYFYVVAAVNAVGSTLSAERSASLTSAQTVFVRGSDNGLWARRFLGTTPGPWLSLGGTITSNPASVNDGSGIWLFARAADNALWFRRSTGITWGPWTPLGGTIMGDPAAASVGNNVYVFARAGDSGIWYRRFDGSTWGPWLSLGGTITSNPAAVVTGTTVHLLARAGDNALWTRRLAGGLWTSWQWLGGSVSSDPTAAADGSGAWVFARGADLSMAAWRLTGSSWGTPQNLGGTITSDPTAAFDGTGVSVIARAADNALWTRRSLNGAAFSPWAWLDGSITSSPTAVGVAGSARVVARAADNALWTRGFDGATWSPWQQLGGVTVTSDPSGAPG
jgi:subtilisin family serine protease